MPLMDFIHEITTMEKHLFGGGISGGDLSVKLFDSQVFDNSCTISAQMQILEKDFGMDLDEFRLAAFAADKGFFDPTVGTDIRSYGGAILKELGYNTTEGLGMSIQNIRQCLDEGKQVIVSLDANELYLPKPQEIQGTLGHSVRIVDYDGDGFSILDPAQGLIKVDSDILAQARNDFNNYALVVEQPDAERLSHIKELYQQKVMAIDADQVAEFKVQNASHILAGNNLDKGVLEYNNQINNGSLGSEIGVSPDIIEIGTELGNIFATGGYYSILEFLKDKPDMQKKVTRAAIGLGALDAVIDVNSSGLELDLEANPLLVASLGVFIIQKLSATRNDKLQRVTKQFSCMAEKGCKAIEFAGYGALGIELVNGFLESVVGDVLLDAFDMGDAFDALAVAGDVGDGVDMVEGLATLGLSIAVSKAVKFTFDKVNSKDRQECERLKKKTAPKVALAKLLEADAPLSLLTGIRHQSIQEGS